MTLPPRMQADFVHRNFSEGRCLFDNRFDLIALSFQLKKKAPYRGLIFVVSTYFFTA